MRTTKVRLTKFHFEDPRTSIPADIYFNMFLHLRKIRKVGDVEVVNNYQLGKMNEAKKRGTIDFAKIP